MNLKEIKDAARQAFRDQQSQDTEGGVPDAISFIAGFVEGARHRQDEINELTNILDFKKETIVEMQNAYETLQVHDEMLIATVDKLKEENKKLVECVKFYANKNTWKRESLSDIARSIIAEDVNEVSGYARYTGGKLARQVLKEISEE